MRIPANSAVRLRSTQVLWKASLRRRRKQVAASFVMALVAGVAGYASLTTSLVHAYGANAFVMVVKTDNPGTSNATSFSIPITGAGYSYNVDCNDDGINEVTARTTAYTCVYGSAGTKTIAITGTFPRIYFNNGGDREKLLEVKQWGTIAWTSMANAFYGASNMHVTASDAPNLASVTNMSGMFQFATSMNENINHWNTSTVTNMSYMFAGASAFNQPLSGWNTAAVTDMRWMFNGASAFNQPLTNFNTAAVTDMSAMFSGASAFNQPLNSWNTSAVTDMSWMFNGASAFNQPLTSFNTGAVTNMSGMFSFASAFNQPIGSWNTGAVTNMSGMFYVASAFNQSLNGWNTGSVTDMGGVFYRALAFNQPLNSWNTSAVTNMSYMFAGASASAFNQPLNTWDTSVVTNMQGMFSGASAFNQPLNSWNTSAVTDMSYMFNGASAFNQPLPGWDIAAVTNMNEMFDGSGLSSGAYGQILANLAGQAVQPGVTLGAADIFYCSNEADRATLTSAPNNWTINDGGFCPATIESPGNIQLVSTATPTISGMAYPSRVVHIAIDGTDYTTTAQGDGSYSYQVVNPLADGRHTVIVRSTDSLGAPGAPTQTSFYVHTGGTIGLSGIVQAPTLSWDKAPGVAAGTTWYETAQGASSFPARGGFGTAVMGGKLWAVGGQGISNNRLKDVWSSTDGVTWTQALANAPWSARNSHTLTAFNGKLWVMGGSGNAGVRLNDIWSSPDGVTWTQETANAAWSPRNGHRVVEHGGKLWLMGGVGPSGGLNDVWNSTDGVNWTQVTGSAGWSVRNGFGATAFNGKLWVMGGANNGSGPFTNDVWSSTDGITWTEETANAAWPVRASLQVQTFDGKMWVLGGSAADWDSEYSDVWFSENGRDWIRTTEAADWTARRGHSSAVFNNKLWVLGGSVGSSWTTSNDVWRADTPPVTYTVCWDTTNGGCAHTATTDGTQTFTIPSNLAPGTWYFKVQATGPQGQSLGSFTASPYTVTNPVPVSVPLAPQPVVHPVTGATSTVTLSPALTNATLSVASYDCSDLQTASVSLVEPDGLKTSEANVTLLGGVGFRVDCTSNGKSTDVALALGTAYRDTNKLRIYKQSGTTLVDITEQVTFTNKDVNGTMKTVVSYTLVDGSSLDEDGVANGILVDPIFIGVVGDAGGELANTGTSMWLVTGAALVALSVGFVLISFALRRPRRVRPECGAEPAGLARDTRHREGLALEE